MAKTYEEIIREFHESVRDAIVSRPHLSYEQLGKEFGISDLTVLTIARRYGVRRIKTGPKPGWLKKAQKGVV
jgi:hypothetical protein